MKKFIVSLLVILATVSCSSKIMFTKIDQKLDGNLSKEIVLVAVINDSRCPENVQCIWAGEVVFEVAVYEKGKIKEKAKLKLNPENQEEVVSWFANRLPKSKKPFKTVSVYPYPKDGVSVNLRDYHIRLGH